jgi:hypothetical protein
MVPHSILGVRQCVLAKIIGVSALVILTSCGASDLVSFLFTSNLWQSSRHTRVTILSTTDL